MNNLKIGARLGLGFAVVLLLLTALTVVGVLRLNHAGAMTDEMINVRMHNERLIAEWAKVIETNAVRTTAAWKMSDAADQKEFEGQMAAASAHATEIQDEMDKSLQNPEARALYADVLKTRKAYVEARKAVFAAKAAGDMDTGRRLFDSDMESNRKIYLAALKKLSDKQRELLDQSAQDTHRQFASGRTLLLALGTLAMVLGVGFAWWITRSITRPIDEALRVAETVSCCDLTSEIQVTSRDETGRLMSALKNMNCNLVNVVAQVRSGTDTMATASSQIAAGNLDLSSRTEQQASALQQTAASMEQLTATVKFNAEHAREANQLAIDASSIASRGGVVVSEVVSTMGSINDSSRKIVDIISVIDAIAFQTNILALNAAVEAARAGEQGRGFAVVASEVRNLAQRSAAAAKDIKGLIADSVEKVAAGSSLVDRAGRTMDEIVNSIARVTEIMNQITDASDEQRVGIEQVNQAITQMDQVTQQNAALVEQAAAAAESMQEQSARLAEVVSVFKIEMGQEPQRMAAPRRPASALAAASAPAIRAPRAGAQAPKRIAQPATDDGGWEAF